eukprot:TRINITY_DN16601_c0_g1_i1.p1 TRINITY_DN16601_c0_g1~~TRINITY_DN16601_c0_g1_i1.p1  ORF type:complete len:118 (+),score=28.93 TRINITY_DN16601_c0_g1_i1:31-384(+)
MLRLTRPLANMASCAVCYVTAPSKEVGEKLAEGLVSEGLAACVNIVPQVTSVYKWEGKIQKDEETLLMIKTKKPVVKELIEWVTKEHPYDCPEVISTDIVEGAPGYLEFVRSNTKGE